MIAHQISPTGDSEVEPVRSAFETAVQLLEAGRASLLLREVGEPMLTVGASVGIDPRIVTSIRVKIGEGIAGLVAERGNALLGFIDGETFLSVPVRTERGIEGVLNVTERAGGNSYSSRDMALAVTSAAHIGRLIQYGRQVSRDPVSGLYNRRSFDGLLEREQARCKRLGTGFAVMFLDLNNMKAINDRYGHARGDEVIREVGDHIARLLRPYDFAARYGGDEFVILISSIARGEGAAVLEGVTQRVEETIRDLARRLGIPVSLSAGSGSWPEDGSTERQVVDIADRRMYAHKRERKGQLSEDGLTLPT